jgi:hypothetical protein
MFSLSLLLQLIGSQKDNLVTSNIITSPGRNVTSFLLGGGYIAAWICGDVSIASHQLRIALMGLSEVDNMSGQR